MRSGSQSRKIPEARVFRYQFCRQTTNDGIGIKNTCPAQSDKIVPVPDHRSGYPRVRVRFRMPPPESLMSSGDSCAAKGTDFSRSRWGFGSQPAAVWGCHLVAECGLVHRWCGGGSGPYDVALGVCESLLRECLPSGDCDFSCTQIGDNSGCLDARSLTSPRCGPGVGQSAKAETYVITRFSHYRKIK